MGYGTPDPYYQPEKFDLVPVGEIDYSDGCYQFDIRAVWKHEPTGTFYTCRDSGCSCPSPFEDYHSLDQLEVLNLEELEEEIQRERHSEWNHSHQGSLAYAEFLMKVRDAVKAG